MAHPNKIKYSFLSKLCGFANISLFLFIGISYFYINEMESFIWHTKHPDPIFVNGLKVTVPKEMKSKRRTYSWKLYPFNTSKYAIISIEKLDINQKESSLGFLRNAGYSLKEIPCKISVGGCKWIQGINLEKRFSYVEKIFITKQRVELLFKGKKDERRYFLEIIEKLKLSPTS